MIEEGSTVILRTDVAIYSPCRIVALGSDNITVAYFTSTKKDRGVHKTEVISRRNIVSMLERK